MGYNNPAFVDDDNKSSNTRTSIQHDEPTNAPANTVHETTVNGLNALCAALLSMKLNKTFHNPIEASFCVAFSRFLSLSSH